MLYSNVCVSVCGESEISVEKTFSIFTYHRHVLNARYFLKGNKFDNLSKNVGSKKSFRTLKLAIFLIFMFHFII